jgi:hypothetical protein
MAGPIIILDKSAFQALSYQEHITLDIHFESNLVPPLVYEILGDLSKQFKNGVLPEQKVQELARKFGGSGGVVAFPYDELCVQALHGAEVPMTGQIIPDNWFQAPSGGVLIDLSPLNHAIMRWANGDFNEIDRIFAERWRGLTRSPGFSSVWTAVQRHHIVIPKPNGGEGLDSVVNKLVDDPKFQGDWVEILLELFQLGEAQRGAIRARWAGHGILLRTFAPYSHHCLRVWVALVTAVHHGLLKWDATHLIDIQYLYYAAFCQVFASDDRVHRLLAPILLRENQSFVRGTDLKAALKRERAERDAWPPDVGKRLRWALNDYPIPRADSLLYQLWKKHMAPWRGGPIVPTLNSVEERELALQEARALFAAAGDPIG